MSESKYVIYKYIIINYEKLIVLKRKYILIDNMRYMCN